MKAENGTRLPFSVMAKPTGARCNLDCTYCFYLEKGDLYPEVRSPCMADEVLENYIQRFIASQPGDRLSFVWQGGEPTLMGVDYYRRVVDLQKKYANGKTIENAFQTNGVLLDDAWCELFAEGNFLVGISIDGPEDLHDAYRVNKRGGGSLEQVMRGLEALKRNRVEFNTLTVLHRANANHASRIYRFLKQIGSNYHQYIPVVERAAVTAAEGGRFLVPPAFSGAAEVTAWSLSSEQYGAFLVAVFDEWVRQDVGRVFVQLFDSALSTWVGRGAELCIFHETCGLCVAMEHNGDLYACDHYVYPDYRLGNILDDDLENLVFSPQQLRFGQDKRDTLTAQCRSCAVLAACNGGCPKHRIATSCDGEPGQNHFCAAYYRFFTHAAPYMRVMAHELRARGAPAKVMAWAREKDAGFASLKVGRNDLCPCSSGRKFKKCCGAH